MSSKDPPGGDPPRLYTGADPAVDDWLAEEGRIDWLREPEEPRREPFAPASGPEVWIEPDAPAAPPNQERDRRQEVIRRRRIVGLVALAVVLVTAIAVPVVLLDGGKKAASPTTTPPPTATTPPATTTQVTTGTSTAVTPPAATLKLVLPASGSLRKGDSGAEVKVLQQALTALGSDTGGTDGVFGDATATAVSAFQDANALPSDGVVGAATAAKLNAVLAERGITG